MGKLQFGIVGIGHMGQIHAANIFQGRLPGVRLAAVADLDPQARKWAGEQLKGTHIYSDYKEMAAKEKLDGVIIVTPHYSHPEIAEYFISRGINTLIEKPLAVTAEAAGEIIACHNQHPQVVCGVAFNQRSNPVYRKAREIIGAGKLGTIRSARYEISDWYRTDAYYRMNPWRGSLLTEGGGCLINQCAHQLDLVQWILGAPLKVWADCQTVNRQMSCENQALSLWSYPTFHLVFSASCHDMKGINLLEVSGDQGRLSCTKKTLTVYYHQDDKEYNSQARDGYFCPPSRKEVYHYGYNRFKDDSRYGQQLRSLKAFKAAILKKGRLLASLEDGLAEDQLLNAIYYSSWTGQEVRLPLDPKIYEKALEEKRQEEKLKAGV
jgi:predicted dehydrogenase